METGAHPTELHEEPIWILRLRTLQRLAAQRLRVVASAERTAAERERLAEIAEEARALGMPEAARSAEARA